MKIKLIELVKVSTLRHRDTAKMIVVKVLNVPEEGVIIDFEDIEFASRSFCHELKKGLKGKDVEYINMRPEVDEMMQLVAIKPKVDIKNGFEYKKLELIAS